MSGPDGRIFVPVAIGLIGGIIFGELAQALFPQIIDAINNAVVVEGSWKEVQNSSQGAIRVLVDMAFGLSGVVSLFAIFTLFDA